MPVLTCILVEIIVQYHPIKFTIDDDDDISKQSFYCCSSLVPKPKDNKKGEFLLFFFLLPPCYFLRFSLLTVFLSLLLFFALFEILTLLDCISSSFCIYWYFPILIGYDKTNRNLWVSGFSSTVTDKFLIAIFSKYGKVCWMKFFLIFTIVLTSTFPCFHWLWLGRVIEDFLLSDAFPVINPYLLPSKVIFFLMARHVFIFICNNHAASSLRNWQTNVCAWTHTHRGFIQFTSTNFIIE